MASILHYNFVKKPNFNDDFSSEGNIEYLRNRREFLNIQSTTIPEIKMRLIKNKIECRYPLGGEINS